MTLKKKNYLILLSFAILFLLTVFLIVWPLFKNIKNIATDLKKEKENLITLQAEIKNLQFFKNKYQRGQEVQKIKNFFIDPKVPVAFIAFLEETAQETKITLEISSLPGKKEKEQPSPALRFLLKGRGLFSNFYRFLSELEKAPYLIEIETLNIKSEEQGKNINVSLTLKVYAKEQ